MGCVGQLIWGTDINGKEGLLLVGDCLTDDPSCCCDVVCCACSWLVAYHAEGKRLKVTMTGAITGYIILCPDDIGAPPNNCMQWTENCDGAFDNVVDPCGLLITGMQFRCLSTEAKWSFEVQAGSASCDLSTPALISEDCGPPLVVVYRSTVGDLDETCECVDETVTFTITPFDPI